MAYVAVIYCLICNKRTPYFTEVMIKNIPKEIVHKCNRLIIENENIDLKQMIYFCHDCFNNKEVTKNNITEEVIN